MAASIIQQKRFTNEKTLLAKEPLHYTTAYPDKENPLIWYCLIVGQKGTPYHGGQYIYKVHHSPKYPAEPPDYYFLTPCGRYEVNKKICLTNSSYHKGEWSSTWNIKTILISFYSIFLDDNEHGISHIVPDSKKTLAILNQERKQFAKDANEYNKKHHSDIYSKFDLSHLSDDAPNTPIVKPVATVVPVVEVPVVPVVPVVEVPVVPVVPVVEVPVVPVVPVVDIPVVPVVEVPLTEVHMAEIPVSEVEKQEDKPKKAKKVAKKNIKIMDDKPVNISNYDKLSDNIKDINDKLKAQFENIQNLEKDISLFK
jgi:ubiquitin-protein ligase